MKHEKVEEKLDEVYEIAYGEESDDDFFYYYGYLHGLEGTRSSRMDKSYILGYEDGKGDRLYYETL